LDEDEKGVDTIDTPGGLQKVTIINESGLYSLILRKPEAAILKRLAPKGLLSVIRQPPDLAPLKRGVCKGEVRHV
jgi:anti-repressor protein